MTLKPPPAGVTHWRRGDLAKQVGLSHTTVHRIWKAHALKPHRVEPFKFSTNPKAEAKTYDVVGLCLNPAVKACVLSVDEKTQIQVLTAPSPCFLSDPVCRPVRPTTIGATGSPACVRRWKWPPARRYRTQDLHVIVDNSSTHTTPAVKACLKKHPRAQFHFTPKGASWVNLVEASFSILTRKSVLRGSFDSIRALTQHIRNYIDHWNRNPTPSAWTQQPADIVANTVSRER